MLVREVVVATQHGRAVRDGRERGCKRGAGRLERESSGAGGRHMFVVAPDEELGVGDGEVPVECKRRRGCGGGTDSGCDGYVFERLGQTRSEYPQAAKGVLEQIENEKGRDTSPTDRWRPRPLDLRVSRNGAERLPEQEAGGLDAERGSFCEDLQSFTRSKESLSSRCLICTHPLKQPWGVTKVFDSGLEESKPSPVPAPEAPGSWNKARVLKEHDVKLGFMSAFARACMLALHGIPAANVSIEGDEIIEKEIVALAKARDGKLTSRTWLAVLSR
ncbi:hypothetical protein BJ138DRAFT_1201328, partial [Hygrophoropsis aurantiaca]